MPRRPASPLHLQSSEELNYQLSKPAKNMRAPSPSTKGQRAVSKISCALSALKCSSRALEDKDYEQHRRDQDFVHPSESPTQFLSSQELDDSLPRRTMPQVLPTSNLHPESYVSDESSTGSNGDGSEASERLWKIATVLVEDENAHQSLPPAQGLSERIPSEDTQDTQDTNDTPNTSNRDPARDRLSVDTQSSDLPDAAFDAFCEENYNAPRTIRSKGSLGDSITPLASPEQEGGHPPHSPVVDPPLDPALLALPSMTLAAPVSSSERRRSVASSAASSSLAGEFCLDASTNLVGSKKVTASSNALNLHADHATVRIGQQELRAATQPKPSQTSTMLKAPTYQSLSKNEDSSYSSVSSFADVHGQPNRRLPQHHRNKQVGGKALTPHPFFWRSHPTTVTRSDPSVAAPSAYDYEYPQTPQYHVYNTSRTHSFQRQAQSPDSISDWHSPDLRHTESKQTYMDPNIVRNMWMESKPFGLRVNTQWKVNGNSLRHPQGPPSTRSAALVQSLTSFATNRLPSVFARSESTRLEQHTV